MTVPQTSLLDESRKRGHRLNMAATSVTSCSFSVSGYLLLGAWTDHPSTQWAGRSGFNTTATPIRKSLTLLASSATPPAYLPTYSPDSVPRAGTAASCTTIRRRVSDHCAGWLSTPCNNCTATPSTFVISWYRRTGPARG